MLTPREIQAMSADLIQVYTQIEDDLVVNVARRFIGIDEIDPDTVTEWQVNMLNELGALRRDNIRAIKKQSGKTMTAINRILNDAGFKALEFDEAIYELAHSKGMLVKMPVPARSSPMIAQIIQGATDNTRSYFNMINTTALQSAQDGFLRIVNQSYLETSLGISDLPTAVRKGVRNLADIGITGADYISDAGRHTRNHIDVAVRRAIVTSTSQTAGQMQFQRAKEWGSNLVEVTSHIGARPSHAVWQGKIYSLEGGTAEYPNLAAYTGYGTVTGLCGANCGHRFFPFFEGIDEQTYFPMDEKENARVYQESQQQRKLERDIRQQKRRVLTADASGDANEKHAAQIALKDKEAKLNQFIADTGRTKRTNRQQVMDFGHSEASKAVWAKRKLADPVKYPNDAFKQTIAANKLSDPKYETALTGRFISGDTTARKVFAKHVAGRSVVDGAYNGNPHYSIATKKISMDFADDATNVRGLGATYFHEHGHLVDYSAGSGSPVSAAAQKFKEALQNDFDSYIINYKTLRGITDNAEAYRQISDDLMKTDKLSAVSDIMDGISKGKISGGWGHNASYWTRDPNRITTESFAHLFEAQFSAERLRLFTEYFPTAAKEFKSLLEGLL